MLQIFLLSTTLLADTKGLYGPHLKQLPICQMIIQPKSKSDFFQKCIHYWLLCFSTSLVCSLLIIFKEFSVIFFVFSFSYTKNHKNLGFVYILKCWMCMFTTELPSSWESNSNCLKLCFSPVYCDFGLKRRKKNRKDAQKEKCKQKFLTSFRVHGAPKSWSKFTTTASYSFLFYTQIYFSVPKTCFGCFQKS